MLNGCEVIVHVHLYSKQVSGIIVKLGSVTSDDKGMFCQDAQQRALCKNKNKTVPKTKA